MPSPQEISIDADTREECLRLIDLALNEDLGSSSSANQLDCTTESVVPDDVHGKASFVAREQGVICGIAVCQLIVDRLDRQLQLDVLAHDGHQVLEGQKLAVLSGNAQDILVTERTCLNFLGRLSGISTLTRRFVNATANTQAKIYDTRKTLPGWRRLEKYAVRCGGGENHRMGLYDAMLIKDNHLAMLAKMDGSEEPVVPRAIESAKRWISENLRRLSNGQATVLQIEVDRLEQLKQALPLQPDIVLLDNMSIGLLEEAVDIRNQMAPNVELEASGGVNLQTVRKIAMTGVDRISVGALTHSAVNFDIGLDWEIG